MIASSLIEIGGSEPLALSKRTVDEQRVGASRIVLAFVVPCPWNAGSISRLNRCSLLPVC